MELERRRTTMWRSGHSPLLLLLAILPSTSSEKGSRDAGVLKAAGKLLDAAGVRPRHLAVVTGSDAAVSNYMRGFRTSVGVELAASVLSLADFCSQEVYAMNATHQTATVFTNLKVDDGSLECLNEAARRTRYHRTAMVIVLGEVPDRERLDRLVAGTHVNSGVFVLLSDPDSKRTLSEIYRSSPEMDVQVNDISRVHEEGGDDDEVESLTRIPYAWERRRDLSGRTFVGISQTWSPFVTTMETDADGRVAIQGLYVDIMDILAQRLNFSIELLKNKEEAWEHMVSVVASRRADLALTGFSHTYERVLRVDFSVPFSASSIRLLYGRQNERSPMHVYLGSFLQDAWLGILTSITTFVVLLFTLSFLSSHFTVSSPSSEGGGGRKDGSYQLNGVAGGCLSSAADSAEREKRKRERRRRRREGLEFSLPTTAVFVTMAFLGRRFPREPRRMSMRLAFASISMGGFIVISLYRAMLGASLAVKIHHAPITSLEQLTSSDHEILIMNGTSVYRYFSEADPGSPQHRLYTEKIAPSSYTLPVERVGMQLIANGTTPNSILIGVFQPLTTHPAYPCSVTSLPTDLRPRGNGLIFQKGWPYTELFNYHLLKMHEEGIISQLRQTWTRTRDPSTCGDANVDGSRRVEAGLQHVVTLFMLWGAGLCAAIAVCLAETLKRGLFPESIAERSEREENGEQEIFSELGEAGGGVEGKKTGRRRRAKKKKKQNVGETPL